jgi:signal peptidase I
MNGLILGGMLVAVYMVINLLLPAVPVNTLIKTYLIQPFIWVIFILVMRFLPGIRTMAKGSLRHTSLQMALAIALLQISLYAIGGLFSGFGKNPSSFTPLGILENLFFVGTMLVAIEMSRAWLITHLGKRHNFVALASITAVFTFIAIPWSQISSFHLQMQSINLVISAWVPLLAENLFASLLAMLAGSRASLLYRGLLAAFWWFCPILPDLNWSLKGLIGAAVPILGMVTISSYYSAQTNRGKSRRRAQKTSFPAGWIVTTLAAVVIAWFAVGVFPFQPSVIPTGSMMPVINPGDVVIVAKTSGSQVKLGDIIEYRNPRENVNIVHRVIEVRGEGEQKIFVAKGDNNNAPDIDPVPQQNVIGKVVFNVPKLGWISLVIKNILHPTV